MADYYYDEKKNEFQPPYQKQLTVLVATDTPIIIDKMFGRYCSRFQHKRV